MLFLLVLGEELLSLFLVLFLLVFINFLLDLFLAHLEKIKIFLFLLILFGQKVISSKEIYLLLAILLAMAMLTLLLTFLPEIFLLTLGERIVTISFRNVVVVISEVIVPMFSLELILSLPFIALQVVLVLSKLFFVAELVLDFVGVLLINVAIEHIQIVLFGL